MSTGEYHRERAANAMGGERITYRETEQQLDRLDTLVDQGLYSNRSDAIRTAVRQLVDEELEGDRPGENA